MKISSFLVLLVLFIQPMFAQTPYKQVLFDTTKLETSGNADWIISAYEPPSPAQSGITQSTPGTYWTGAISSWGVALVKLGYAVHSLMKPYAITYGNTSNPFDLSNYNLFIVCEPQVYFTTAEQQAIIGFVQHGGGLFMVSDHDGSDRNNDGADSPMIWDSLGARKYFGIHFQSKNESDNNISDSSKNVAVALNDSVIHGPGGTATQFDYHNGTTFTLYPDSNASVAGHVWRIGAAQSTTKVMAATATYGLGRVGAIGDSSPADDGTARPKNSSIYDGWDEASDGVIILNMSVWLASAPRTVTNPPAQVTLLSPTNNATNISIPETFSWRHTDSTTTYNLQVSTSSSFTSFAYNDSSITDTTKSVSALSANATYYWRVRAGNSGGWGTYSSVWSFATWTTPSQVTTVYPANSSTAISVPVGFLWNKLQSITNYNLQVSTSNTFTTFVVNDSSLTDSTSSISGLNANTIYYWKVRAKNAAGWGATSSIISFTTWSTPSQVTTVFPANASPNVQFPVSLLWNKQQNILNYNLQLSTSNTFNTYVVNDSSLIDTTSTISALSANTMYYWKVRAKNSAGWGSFSTVVSFTSWNPPAQVTTVYPTDGSTNLSIPIGFFWNKLTSISNYNLQVSTSNTFSPFVLNDSSLTDTTSSVSSLSPNTQYYWKVRAKNSAGWGSFSATISFTTWNAPPQVTTVFPADSTKNISLPVGFLWNKQQNVLNYEVQVSISNTFSSLTVDDSSLTDTTSTISGLNLNTVYYWRVRAKNVVGWGVYSNVISFTTWNTPLQVTTVFPVDSSKFVSTPVGFLWRKQQNVLNYNLQISTSSSFTSFVVDDSSLTDTSSSISVLSLNTLYFWRVRAKNGAGWGDSGSTSSFTTWNVPGQGSLVSPMDSTTIPLPIVFRWQTVSTATGYEFELTDTTSFDSLIVMDTVLTSDSINVPGLDTGYTYLWRVRARNGAGYGAYSSVRSFRIIGALAVTAILNKGWNMLSVPVEVTDERLSSIFPASVSNAFAFTNSYVTKDTLQPGTGYWLKYPAQDTLTITGLPINSDTIVVKSGWNLIGTISNPTPVGCVQSIGTDIVSNFYMYHSGYFTVTTLEPMQAYWVKVSVDGKLALNGNCTKQK